MKLPILKRDTASALAKTNEELAATEAQIAALQQERLEKILDAELGEIERLDQQIIDRHRQRAVLTQRVAGLEQRLEAERIEQSRKDYAAAVTAIEPSLARRTEAAIALEKSPAPANARRFVELNSAVTAAWPSMVPWPNRVFSPAYLSVERLAQRVRDALEPPRGHADRRPRTPAEYLTRFLRFDLAGFGAEEAEQAHSLLNDLRHAHDPLPAEDVENAA
jgi:hypothetical protein